MVAISWQNADGLGIQYGTNEAIQRTGGEFKTFGALRQTEILLTLSTLTSSAVIQDNNALFPKNARIEYVDVEVVTAASTGSSPTLDVGFIRYDRSTELDYNGLVAAAAASTIDTAGKKLTLINGATAAGALIGTTTAYPSFFTANYNTAAFTTGVIAVRVMWRGIA